MPDSPDFTAKSEIKEGLNLREVYIEQIAEVSSHDLELLNDKSDINEVIAIAKQLKSELTSAKDKIVELEKDIASRDDILNQKDGIIRNLRLAVEEFKSFDAVQSKLRHDADTNQKETQTELIFVNNKAVFSEKLNWDVNKKVDTNIQMARKLKELDDLRNQQFKRKAVIKNRTKENEQLEKAVLDTPLLEKRENRATIHKA